MKERRSFLMELLFPPRCILCRDLLKEGETDLCPYCREYGPEYPERKIKRQFLDSFTAVWYYEGSVRKSLHRYKFGNARHYAPAYGRMLARRIRQRHPDGLDVLAWVPVSPLRKLTRGYDQCQLLADAVGKELGMTPVPLLKKVRHNRTQSGITDPDARKANVLNVYRLTDREAVSGKRILLLDDIYTTGATVGECARVLLTAGAEEVHCATVATRK